VIKTIIVDDEQPAIEEIEYLLSPYEQVKVVQRFKDPRAAMDFIAGEKPDLLFLDIDMPHMDGIELALKIQAMNTGVTIVFVTAHSQYALEAFQAYPLDYILKPVDEDRFRQTMNKVLERLGDRRKAAGEEQAVRIHCFGPFEIITGAGKDKPVPLRSKKMKEIFAYLIQRFEKPVSRAELLERFFGGKKDKNAVNYLHVIIYNLRNLLEEHGVSRKQVLIDRDYSLSASPGCCDYIDFVRFMRSKENVNEHNAAYVETLIASYRGAYLEEEDYSWAREEREWLEGYYEELHLKLARYYQAAGLLKEAESTLERLTNFNILSEDGWQALLQLYLAEKDSFSKTAYLNAYERYSKMLERELGLEPEERFQKQYREML